MGLYAVVKGNLVDGIAIADAPLETDGLWICVDDLSPQPGRDWSYINGKFLPPMNAMSTQNKKITKIAFRFRLTDAEYAGILNAAKNDIEIAAWVETFNMTSNIDLISQKTKSGIAKLVEKSLLAHERATEILNAEIQPEEQF